MAKALEILMNEHRLIEQVLGSLETFVRRPGAGDAADRKTLGEYARFFREFADRCHHAKEEDQLFVQMTRHGFPREVGPIAVMLSDHEEGREHVAALAAAGEGMGPLGAEELETVRRYALQYALLLRMHIQKEDNILYPMALRALPGNVMNALVDDFERHEREVMGNGAHEALHGLAERLLAANPPDPSRAAGSSCVGCAGSLEEAGL